MSKRVCIFIPAFLMIVLLLALTSALTGKIGNARMVLYPEVGFWGTSIDKTILVINDNSEEVSVKLQASENSSFIEITDKEFTLQPGEQRDAKFKINIRKEGDYEGRINVFFAPFSGNGAGVVLSSTIIIHASGKGSSDDGDNGGGNTDSESDVALNIGEFVSDENNRGLVIASISTAVLAIILIVMLVLSRKKERKIKKKRANDRS